MSKIIPNKIKIGDTIGVVAPSSSFKEEDLESKQEFEQAIKIVKEKGFNVKLSKNIYKNTNGYSATAKEKADDINQMFQDEEVKMIWCAKGGENSNIVFDKLDYEIIRKNPKIICGYSDITSIVNMINAKTGLVTFNATNFKSIATDETDYSYNKAMERFLEGSLELSDKDEKYEVIQKGIAEGELIGGNLSLTYGMVEGKYKLDFKDKILFLEELGYETGPELISNYLYYMKQNGVFDKIKGLWIGNYEHESQVPLEKIILDTLEGEYELPIIKSNNFGHIERKIAIPIGVKAKIDTSSDIKIELLEKCVK